MEINWVSLWVMPVICFKTGWKLGNEFQRVTGFPEVTNMTYLASSGLCIGAIACLANQKTARVGNALGLMGVSGGLQPLLGWFPQTLPSMARF